MGSALTPTRNAIKLSSNATSCLARLAICRVTGSAGKFESLEAALVITSHPLKSNFDGIGLIGHKKGTYKIAKTN